MLALLLLFVGYALGVAGGSNIVFPLFWAWPKAVRLQREGRLLVPIPAYRFLRPVVIWGTILGGSYLLVAWLAQDSSGYYATGIIIAGAQNVWALLKPTSKMKADMEADFNDSYGQGHTTSDKFAAALLKVSANLFDVATDSKRTDHAPIVLRFERASSRLQFFAFSLATAYFWSSLRDEGDRRLATEKALDIAWDHAAAMVRTWKKPDGLVTAEGDKEEAIRDAKLGLSLFIGEWAQYYGYVSESQRLEQPPDQEGPRIICEMLRSTESALPLNDDDTARLMPLAKWIEGEFVSIASSVERLAR